MKRTLLFLKFLIPSLIGIMLFMFPIRVEGSVTIPIAVCSNFIVSVIGDYFSVLLVSIITISFVGSIVVKTIFYLRPETKLKKSPFLKATFDVSKIWFAARAIAFVFAICTYQTIGTEMIYSMDTGGLVFYGLLPILFTVFLLAGFFLPLLLNFGLLEFAGALLIKVMRPVFGLPGRAAIDAIASWLGDGSIGVLLTSKQYEEGFYTEKEACVIGTAFSLVSITFSLVVINQVGLGELFVPFYLTVTFACLVAAILLPKFGPLSKKKDVLIDGTVPKQKDFVPEGKSSAAYGLELALNRAEKTNLIKSIVVEGVTNVMDMWFSVIPIVMAIGTIALMLEAYTPIFRILGLPLLPLLWLLRVPEAVAASQTLLAGFADMLLPSVMISSVTNEMTRFVIASVSVTQLIYLSEVGALLLASKIPLSLKELFIIFIQRTIITLPIIAVIGHILF